MASFGMLWGANGAADNQEIEHQSGVERLFNNICCALCGTPIMLLIAVILLGWNERRAVCNNNAIVAGQHVVKEVGCDSATAGSGDLVLFSCDLKKEGLQPFAVTGDFSNALSSYIGTGLKIKAEMYQCVETESSETKKDNVGGGKSTIKTYTYSPKWQSSHVNSGAFKKKSSQNYLNNCGHENPAWPSELPTSETLYAQSAKVGPFTIVNSFVRMIDLTSTIVGSSVAGWNLNGGIYTSDEWRVPGDSNIGAARVSFEGTDWTRPKHTVLGENKGGTINSWTAPDSWLCSGFTLSEVRAGTVDSDTLFEDMVDANAAMTWILSFVCFKFYRKGHKVADEDKMSLAQPEAVGQAAPVAPVAQETAQAFVQAVRDEYVNGKEGAVGECLDGLPQEEQDKLVKFEEEVQAASDKEQAIDRIAKKLEVS